MADESNVETIWIVTDDASQVSEPHRSYREVAEKGVKVSVPALEQKMSRFLKSVSRIFHQAEQETHKNNAGMQLDEIELSVEISGEGEIKLMGTGGKAGSKGAIKLTFKRTEPK